jgi:quercetin dioxygenase-like cupin family protein
MPTPTFEDFQAAQLALGFDEVLVREWSPGQVVDTHTHPFAVQARVVRGELALTARGHTRRLVAGSGFELARDEPHAEHYGPEGATFWVARRHGPTA